MINAQREIAEAGFDLLRNLPKLVWPTGAAVEDFDFHARYPKDVELGAGTIRDASVELPFVALSVMVGSRNFTSAARADSCRHLR